MMITKSEVAEVCEICEGKLRLENRDNCSVTTCERCGHEALNGIGTNAVYLTLARPEKALMIASLCISHPELQPTMDTPITVQLAQSSLDVSLPVLRLFADSDTLIALLTLINARSTK